MQKIRHNSSQLVQRIRRLFPQSSTRRSAQRHRPRYSEPTRGQVYGAPETTATLHTDHTRQSNLNQQPRAYMGPRYSPNESLQERYVNQWSQQRPAGTSSTTPQTVARPERHTPVPPYHEQQGAIPNRASQQMPPAESPQSIDRTASRAANRAVATGDKTPTPYRPTAQRVEMRHPAYAPTAADELTHNGPMGNPSAAVDPGYHGQGHARSARNRQQPNQQEPNEQRPWSALLAWWQQFRLQHQRPTQIKNGNETLVQYARFQFVRNFIDAIVGNPIVTQRQQRSKQSSGQKHASATAQAASHFFRDWQIDLRALIDDLRAGRFTNVSRQLSWPGTVRMSLLGVIVFLLWWTWPTAPTMPTGRTSLARNALALAPALQSGNQRIGTFTDQGQASIAEQQSAFTILVPTATPDANTAQLANNAVAPAVVSMRVDGEVVEGAGLSMLDGILVATSTPARIDAAVVTVSVPKIQIIPGVSINLPFGQPTPTPTPEPTPTPTPVPVNLVPGRLWSTFAPGPESDHFWVGRSFGFGAEQLSSPSYQFGSTAGNRYRTHHGVDISNPFGTPVLAATDGEVVHAGPDDTALLGPYNNFYGNVVVIRLNRKLSVAGGELDVFLLYGHLSQVTVQVGDQVQPEDVVGMVGMTGIAIGPHLHVEIRLGANTYFNNVNPYLWVAPLEGYGTVAVRVLTADGRTWPDARISLVRYAGGTAAWARQIVTYMDVENIGPDPAWGENGAMEGVPAGSYYVIGVVNGERLSAEITVEAGRTSFIELRTQQ